MAIIATELKRLSHVVKTEFWPDKGYCRLAVVANEAGAKTYKIGTVLGKVTATGKYKESVQTATDGSQVPAAVVMVDATLSAATDTSVLALVRGPAIVGNLELHASFNDAAKVAAARAALDAIGIMVLDAV